MRQQLLILGGKGSVNAATRSITFVVDGAGSAITTGEKSASVRVPWNGTITKATLLADQAGDAVVDVWKDSLANFPPTVADSICGAAKPTLAAAQKSEDTTLTGWTTQVVAGDVFKINVDSAATLTHLTLILEVKVS